MTTARRLATDGPDPSGRTSPPGSAGSSVPPPRENAGGRGGWRWVAPFCVVCAAHLVAVWTLSETLARVEPVVVPPVVGQLVTPEVVPPKELPVAPPPPVPPQADPPPRPKVERTPPKPRVPRPAPPPVVTAEPSDRAPAPPDPPPPDVAPPPVAATPPPAPVEAAPRPAPPAPPPPAPPPVTPPRADAAHLSNPPPVYPALSRRLGEQGRVLLDVHILADGSVGEVRLKRSSGHPRLDQSALEAVRGWRYVPARRGSEPIPYWYVQPIEFSLGS